MDCYDEAKRSAVMAAVRSKDTKPELYVRKLLFGAGYRYRHNVDSLPGKPDIVLKKYRTAIFVHGCFWHSHEGCPKATVLETKKDFWTEKLSRNVARDREVRGLLLEANWRVLVVWQCACRKRTAAALLERMIAFLNDPSVREAEIGRDDVAGPQAVNRT